MTDAAARLLDLATLEGFSAAALFSPSGELLAACGGDGQLEAAGRLAADVLQTAKQASLALGAGHGHQVHLAGEKAQILVRCLNEGTDPLRSEPGKAHLHLVVVLAPGASVALARARMVASLEALADRFRT